MPRIPEEKFGFGMRTNGPDHMPYYSNTPDFSTIELVAEHTAQQNLGQQKWIQFARYKRFALYNELDRVSIFGLLIHKSECYLAIFLDSCIIVASPFPLSNLVTVIRVVAASKRLDLLVEAKTYGLQDFEPNLLELHCKNRTKLGLAIEKG